VAGLTLVNDNKHAFDTANFLTSGGYIKDHAKTRIILTLFGQDSGTASGSLTQEDDDHDRCAYKQGPDQVQHLTVPAFLS
jgi:hypothetical protein